MVLNKQAILKKTNYGLNIYSFILMQYYPTGAPLSLSGRVCKPAQNPFNNNKLTLIISIIDNCARHYDTDNCIFNGDVFDFAALYFKQEGLELLQTINKELYLHIGEETNSYSNQVNSQLCNRNLQLPMFSYFRHPISNTKPSNTISITQAYHVIKDHSFLAKTLELRSVSDINKARKYKAKNFDYVTFSGTFSNRNDKALIKHSGLLTIDFDHISNIQSLKNKLILDNYFDTELLFTSPSGDGIKWIIPIDITMASHSEYFQAVANYIKHTYKIDIDKSGKDISRACFIPHDNAVYINPKYLL